MRKFFLSLLIMLCVAMPLVANEQEQEFDFSRIFDKNEPEVVAADKMLKFLEKTNPDEADRLRKLRDTDEKQFYEQIHDIGRSMREKYSDMRRRRMAEPPHGSGRGFGQDFQERSRDSYMEAVRRRNEEFMDWLGENYPDKANQIEENFDSNPERAFRDLMPIIAKYRDIFETEKKNPELAAQMKKDIDLRDRRDQILERIAAGADEAEQKDLTVELKQVVEARFDLILYQKQIRFEELRKRLEQLEKEIARQEAALIQLSSQRQEQIQKRVQELLDRDLQLSWD